MTKNYLIFLSQITLYQRESENIRYIKLRKLIASCVCEHILLQRTLIKRIAKLKQQVLYENIYYETNP